MVIPGGPFILEKDETLCIEIIESHERQWVGINALMFYGATLDEALEEEAPEQGQLKPRKRKINHLIKRVTTYFSTNE